MWQVIGQTRAVSLLQCSLERNSVAHAYLFIGPAHVGKMTLALNMAQALNCDETEPPCGQCAVCQKIASGKHADVQVLVLNDENPDENRAKIGVSQIEELQHSANLPPFEGRCKIFIIDGAEFLSIGAANRLLKTLEEPVDKVVFMLLTTNERLLPATVVSRCQRVGLPPTSITEIESALTTRWGIEPEKANLLARLSCGRPGWAVSAASGDDLLQQRDQWLDGLLDIVNGDNEERFAFAAQLATQFSQNRRLVQERLDLWLDWWRDLLLVKVGCSGDITNVDRLATLVEMADGYRLVQIKGFIDSIRAAKEQLKQNANSRLVVEVLMLDIPDPGRRAAGNPAA